jgi:type I restriction enzyme M protein
MLTGKIRNDIDKLWEKFWTGGITNPLTVIEQISYLMFARMLDMQEDVAACFPIPRKANCCAGRTSAT